MGCPGCLERHALALEFMHEVLQVLHGAREAIGARRDDGIAFADAFEEHLQFGAAVAPHPALFLGEDYDAAGGFERGLLSAQVLICGRNARITEDGGAGVRCLCKAVGGLRSTGN